MLLALFYPATHSARMRSTCYGNSVCLSHTGVQSDTQTFEFK